MMNKKNLVVLEGNLVRDAKTGAADGKIVELSVAVDMAGSEIGAVNAPGYFDVKIWMTDSKYTPAALAEQVKKHLSENTLTKGTRVGIVGQLKQERWKNANNEGRSRVTIVVEGLDVYTRLATGGAPAPAAGSVEQAVSASASEEIDEF